MTRLLWTQKQHLGPRPRSGHAMAYDNKRSRTVLFGGKSAAALLGDTWTWDGENWTQVDDIGPQGRFETAMAYDRVRDRTVLFGGTIGGITIGDTWEWDGNDWTQLADSGPSARLGHAMVFDAIRNRVVLFGGDADGTLHNDTWQWDGNEWVQVEDTGPTPRRGHAMAFDATRGGRIVLFGGFDNTAALGDTWEWGGSAWTQLANFGPAPSLLATLVNNGRKSLLFGGISGESGTPQIFGVTWEWDGRHWTIRQDLGPGPRWGHAMVFDSGRNRSVLFGGMAEFTGPTALPLGDTFEQFEEGASPVVQPPDSPLGITSLAIKSADSVEGQPITIEATLTQAPATAVNIIFTVTEGNGVGTLLELAVLASGSITVQGPLLIVKSGEYVVRATSGTSSQFVPLSVAPSHVAPVTGLTANPSNLPQNTPLVLSAVLRGIVPVPLAVPLRLEVAGQPATIWLGPQLQIQNNMANGSVTLPADLFDRIPRPSQITWTATLGNGEASATVTLI